jgi:hypothetical protein
VLSSDRLLLLLLLWLLLLLCFQTLRQARA